MVALAVLAGTGAFGLRARATVGGTATAPLSCDNPNAPYSYGATDASAEVGNSSLTAVLDPAGTVTVLRSTASNYDNQVNFFASGYDQKTGVAVPLAANDGELVGIRYVVAGVPHFSWLRDWAPTQGYLDPGSPVAVTSYTGPNGTGLSVTDEAFATAGPLAQLDGSLPGAGPDAMIQDFAVSVATGSPVSDVQLAAYGNWNPTADQVPYIPLADSGCAEDFNPNKVGYFDAPHNAFVASWTGVDVSTDRPAASAVAFGWSSGTTAWEVGGDSSNSATPPTDPPDGYTELAAAPYQLGDASRSVGMTTAAIMASPEVQSPGHLEAQLITTVSTNPAESLAQLQAARDTPASSELAAVTASWSQLLARARIPTSADQRVVDVSRRAVITALLAIDPVSGAIVASPDTQGPYGEDWTRDGAFIDAMLDENGYTDLVTRHELFYARTQSSPTHPIPTTPVGNWPMVMYPSGGNPGGPIPWEIDETGYGAWTLYDHSTHLPADEGKQYLKEVFPAIARAADWLTACADPTNGFQCPANEDDNEKPTQTIHGGLPVLLALRSAIAAAGSLGVSGVEVSRWQARAATLQTAIESLYDNSAGAYKESPSATSTLPVGFEDSGLMLWPTRLLPYSSPRMQGEAAASLSSMESSWSGTSGAYEAVSLLGVCHADSPLDPTTRQRLGTDLARIMDATATPGTGVFGEFWQRWGDGHVSPWNDMPHTWEGALFDMSALCIYGSG